jgi:signal transduction protein with GAF and PtsI domain
VHLQLLYETDGVPVLAVPVLRDGRIIGVMVVRRKTPGGFSDEVLDSWRRSRASPRSR